MTSYIMFLVKNQKIALLKKYLNCSNIFVKDANYNNLLHIAVATKNLELIKLIYAQNKICLYCKNIDKITPLEMSYYAKKSEIYKYLTSVKKPYDITATPIINYNLDNIAGSLNITNKFIIKEIERISNYGILHTGLFNLIHILKQTFPELDENLLRPLFIYKINCHSFYFTEAEIKKIKLIIKKFSPKRIIKMVLDSAFMKGTLSANFEHLIILSKEDIESINTDNIKKIEQLNSICKAMINKKTQQDFDLKGHKLQEIISNYCSERIKYIVPKKNYDLIRFGEIFSNCVGNGIYANRINDNDIRIVLIFKNNEPHACVEIFYPSMKIGSYKGVSNLFAQGEHDFQDLLDRIKNKNKIKLMLDYMF